MTQTITYSLQYFRRIDWMVLGKKKLWHSCFVSTEHLGGLRDSEMLPEMWHKHAVISICELCVTMYNCREDQKTSQLFTLWLISLDSWQVTHLLLLLCFVYSFFKFLLSWTFHMWGIWIDALTTVELNSSPSFSPACLHWQTFSKWKLGILSLLFTFIFTFPSLNIYIFGERIKACMQGDEWFNLDSNFIKWANRNSWQKLCDEEVITYRLLPYCRRWEWSAGLVYRSNCMTQCREWETDMGGNIPVGFNTFHDKSELSIHFTTFTSQFFTDRLSSCLLFSPVSLWSVFVWTLKIHCLLCASATLLFCFCWLRLLISLQLQSRCHLKS